MHRQTQNRDNGKHPSTTTTTTTTATTTLTLDAHTFSNSADSLAGFVSSKRIMSCPLYMSLKYCTRTTINKLLRHRSDSHVKRLPGSSRRKAIQKHMALDL